MTIQYASDLHLEFSQNRDYLKANPILRKGDILVLAGDIVPFAIMHKYVDFFKYVSEQFQTVYWLPGNHEYYDFDIMTHAGKLLKQIHENIFLVNNTSVQLDDVQLIFTTLWSKISPANAWAIEHSMSDFQRITIDGKRFSADAYNKLHEESMVFLKEELKIHTGKKIIVTHHIPTFLHYPEQYKGDILNEAFAVELADLIASVGPDYWIYGHHHSNVPDFTIGKTKMLTNQLGYVKHGEHHGFDFEKVVRI